MTIRLYDSLSRSLRPLEPLEPGRIGMYVCGPTVYDDCHIGHLMGPVLFDAIARWLRARGHDVRFVNNITDIDDKIIRRALDTGEDWRDIAARYTRQYFDFLTELGVGTVTDHPRCTEYVPKMVEFVEELVAADRAYVLDDGVYYDVARQRDYGKLSGRRIEEMQAGSRVERRRGLRNPADFALWKEAKAGEPHWPSPWGAGRPGWHLECSVMSSALLGDTFDIHGGGDDLKFPHHENEIAQSEAHGQEYARCWMHHGLVQYGGVKIAKSDPRMKDPEFSRQFDARWLLDTYGAPAIRFFLLRGHYRRPIDFEPSNLEGARTALVRLLEQLGARAEEPGEVPLSTILERPLPAPLAEGRERFCAAMDDDFNTGEAVAQLFALRNLALRDQVDGDEAWTLIRDLGRLLGLFRPGDAAALRRQTTSDERLGPVLDFLVELRQQARKEKDWALADRIRDRLVALGIRIQDGPEGASWSLE